MTEDRDLDRFVDAALGTYGDSFADENLAERVLARLTHEPASQPRFRWLPCAAVAFPAAICLLMLVHSGPRITKPHAAPTSQSALLHNPAGISVDQHPPAATRPETAWQINRAASHRHPMATTAGSQPLPKLDVFPTPTPLTRQERALAVYIAHTPQTEQAALAQSEQEPMPVTVASMHVMPLEAPDSGANTN
jgi:hypothetical protein